MFTKFQLYIDFQSANMRAGDLERAANRLRKVAESALPDELHDISVNWTGDASAAFIRKGYELKDKLLAEAKSLEASAETIRRIAKRTYDTEMKALEKANCRIYH